VLTTGRILAMATVGVLLAGPAAAAGTTSPTTPTKRRPPKTQPTGTTPTTTPAPDVTPAPETTAPPPPAPASTNLPMPPPPAPKPAAAPPPEPAPAPTPAPRSQGWSAYGAQGLDGEGQAVTVELGFPVLMVGYLRALNATTDLAVRLDGNYAYEGIYTLLPLYGGHVEASLRIRLLEIAGISGGVHVGAGAFTYFYIGNFVLGLVLPVGATVGIPLGPTLSASLGFEMPMWITFNAAGGFAVPVLGSAALEYFIDRNWAATLRVRAGPVVNPSGFRFGGPVVPQLQVAVGLEWKLQ